MYQKHILKNGIQLVTKQIPSYRSASIGVWVKVGSMHESPEVNGISHFIEHMMFKGTKTWDAKAIAEFFDGVGGDLNAFTSKECTCFHAKVLDNNLPEAIAVIGNMISFPLMNSDDIEKEKGVVLDEIDMAEDSPDDVSYDLIALTTFKNGSLGQPILGNKDTVSTFDQEKIHDYLQSHYTTDNVIISIAGSFDEVKAIEAVETSFQLPQRTRFLEESENKFHGETAFIYRDIEQVHLEITYEGISYCSEKVFTLAAINAMFGASVSSRLFQNIRETHGLTYAINSYISQYETCGLVNIYASMSIDNLQPVLELLKKEIKDIITEGFSNEELSRIKNQIKGNYILDLEGTESYMNLIGKGALFNKPVYSIEEIEMRIDAIDLESVNILAKSILSSNPAISLVGRVDDASIEMCKKYLQEVL
ncbi:MAG: insulinase family protein [Clostridia bacterium]|nr:insulinase family protein [Clostridia bacterium]